MRRSREENAQKFFGISRSGNGNSLKKKVIQFSKKITYNIDSSNTDAHCIFLKTKTKNYSEV